MAHGQAQCPVGLKNGHTGVDGLPCQPISLSLKLRNDFRALQNPFVGNHTSGMAKTANWGISEAPVASLLE